MKTSALTALTALTACEVLARFQSKSLTPSAYLSACLDQIARFNPKINALAAMDIDGATQDAAAATARWQNDTPAGPLDGLPVGVKDLQDAIGLLTTHGNALNRSAIPKQDTSIVASLRAAGAIILAKTNVPELGAGGNSRNPVWGATGNPFDPNLIAGGSSGGSAAALAANFLPLCTGSDTGGSLRLPAALCGVVGFRPSVDVIAHPTRPLGWSGISVLGPMARTVDDLRLMLEVCQKHDVDDPLSAPAGPDRFTHLPKVALRELRVGYSEDFGGLPVDPDIRKTFRDRIARLSPQVKACRAVDLDLGDMDRTFDILRAESFVAAFAEPMKNAPDAFGAHITENVKLGLSMTLADRAWAHAEQTRILRKFNALTCDYDVILLPTSPVSPFSWLQSHANHIEGHDLDIYYRWLALCYRGSLTGGPAITLPTGVDSCGMPFGLQILGAMRQDERLLAISKEIETFFSLSADTARPVPDLENIAPSVVDLRSIVTHPPDLDRAAQTDPSTLRTAV